MEEIENDVGICTYAPKLGTVRALSLLGYHYFGPSKPSRLQPEGAFVFVQSLEKV